MKLEIRNEECEGGYCGTQVLLDGKDISSHVVGFEIKQNQADALTATIRLMCLVDLGIDYLERVSEANPESLQEYHYIERKKTPTPTKKPRLWQRLKERKR